MRLAWVGWGRTFFLSPLLQYLEQGIFVLIFHVMLPLKKKEELLGMNRLV
jgi:hypothetical protein